MQAQCIYHAFDNQTSTHYSPGLVTDFDETNEKLKALTIPGTTKYVFQYPGHTLVSDSPLVESPVESPAKLPAERPKPDGRSKHKSRATIAAMLKKRAENKAAKFARLSEPPSTPV